MDNPDRITMPIVNAVRNSSSQLLLVVGKPGSGKSSMLRTLAQQESWQYVDCRTLLTDEFLELLPTERPKIAPNMMSNILTEYNSSVIVLDSIQVLFVPLLRLSPLKLLQDLSKNQKIIAAWPGEYRNGKLSFRAIGQMESCYFDTENIELVSID